MHDVLSSPPVDMVNPEGTLVFICILNLAGATRIVRVLEMLRQNNVIVVRLLQTGEGAIEYEGQ